MNSVAVIYLVTLVIHLVYSGYHERTRRGAEVVASSALIALGLGVVLAIGELL